MLSTSKRSYLKNKKNKNKKIKIKKTSTPFSIKYKTIFQIFNKKFWVKLLRTSNKIKTWHA